MATIKERVTLTIFAVFVIAFLPQAIRADIKYDLSQRLPMNNVLANALSAGMPLDKAITGIIKEAGSAAEVVEAAIRMGHPPCIVITDAIEAGGNLEQVIVGAFKAGVSSDIIARCAIDAGADPDVVAKIMQQPGLGYSPPIIATPAYIPAFVTPIGGGGGGSVSPSIP